MFKVFSLDHMSNKLFTLKKQPFINLSRGIPYLYSAG